MTREEKLQKLAELIHKEYKAQEPMKGYSEDETITLHSVQIEQSTGIALGEQPDALDVLTNNYGCIKYTATKDYTDESQLTPADLLNMTEVEMMGGPASADIKQALLEAVTYRLTVLNTITDAVNILDGNLCELAIENGVTPVVTIKGTKHELQSLQAGSIPQKIIQYASKGRYDTPLSSDDFETMGIAQFKKPNYNVSQTLKNNIFGKRGALNDFAIITPKTFLLRKKALLSEDKMSAIQDLAQN